MNILQPLIDSYLVTAAWADSPEECNGKTYLFSPESILKAENDCKAFVEKIRIEFTPIEFQKLFDLSDENVWSLVGHDFWLTRNHHGSGYWDKKVYNYIVSDGSDRLTKLAQEFNEVSIYLNEETNKFEIE